MTTIWDRVDGSFSTHDAVRHFMYEHLYEALSKLSWEDRTYRLVEIGSRDPTSSPIRIMTKILGDRLSVQVGNWPEVDIHKMPYSQEWDIFIADQVLEHCERPWIAADEIHRVVKPGGIIIIATPYIHPLHPCPLDCWRISPDGYKVLFPESLWETVEFGMWGNRDIVKEIYTSNVSRGMTGDWIHYSIAKREIPSFDTPTDGLHPIVIWGIYRKK